MVGVREYTAREHQIRTRDAVLNHHLIRVADVGLVAVVAPGIRSGDENSPVCRRAGGLLRMFMI